MYTGIDLSYHNGTVKFSGVRDAGYRYIILRAGYGKNNIDQAFERYAAACVNLDIPFGIYWFSYALDKEMARQEARFAIEAVRKYRSRCLIAYDLEYDSVRYARTNGVHIDRELATEMARVFCEEVASAGYIPVLYSNKDYLKNYFGLDGPKTRYVRKKIALKAKKSGMKISVGSSGELVKYWQRRTNEILGTSIKEDGLFGKETRSNTGALQVKLNLTKDYIAGYNSLSAVFYN